MQAKPHNMKVADENNNFGAGGDHFSSENKDDGSNGI